MNIEPASMIYGMTIGTLISCFIVLFGWIFWIKPIMEKKLKQLAKEEKAE